MLGVSQSQSDIDERRAIQVPAGVPFDAMEFLCLSVEKQTAS
jgi:hypothetical protein